MRRQGELQTRSKSREMKITRRTFLRCATLSDVEVAIAIDSERIFEGS